MPAEKGRNETKHQERQIDPTQRPVGVPNVMERQVVQQPESRGNQKCGEVADECRSLRHPQPEHFHAAGVVRNIRHLQDAGGA